MLRTFSRRFKSTSHAAKSQTATKNGFGERSVAQNDDDITLDEFYAGMIDKVHKWRSFAEEDIVNPGETPE